VKQGFAEHFQNLNLEPIKIKSHGHIELEDTMKGSKFQIDLGSKFREIIK